MTVETVAGYLFFGRIVYGIAIKEIHKSILKPQKILECQIGV